MECYLKKNNLGSVGDYTRHTKKWSILDGVLSFSFDKKEIECFAKIDVESVFYENEYKGIYSYAGFEFIAQAASIYYGLESRLLHGEGPRLGFILCVNNLDCTQMIIPVGKTLVIHVTESLRSGEIAYLEGRIYVDDRLIVKATLMLVDSNSIGKETLSFA